MTTNIQTEQLNHPDTGRGGKQSHRSDETVLNSSGSILSNELSLVELHVTDMSCMSCVARIEAALSELPGVKSVKVDLNTGKVQVCYLVHQIDVRNLITAITSSGYTMAQPGEGSVAESHLEKQRFRPKPYYYGMFISLAAVTFYLSLVTLTSDWDSAKMQYAEYGWWVMALAVGLGIQLTLFVTMRRRLNSSDLGSAKSSVAASGGMSTVAMAACCSHYLGILLPLIGLPFLAAFAAGLAKYQVGFFFVGVIFNLIGMGLMIRQFKHHLIPVSAVLG